MALGGQPSHWGHWAPARRWGGGILSDQQGLPCDASPHLCLSRLGMLRKLPGDRLCPDFRVEGKQVSE